jgi:hypothetical protein
VFFNSTGKTHGITVLNVTLSLIVSQYAQFAIYSVHFRDVKLLYYLMEKIWKLSTVY